MDRALANGRLRYEGIAKAPKIAAALKRMGELDDLIAKHDEEFGPPLSLNDAYLKEGYDAQQRPRVLLNVERHAVKKKLGSDRRSALRKLMKSEGSDSQILVSTNLGDRSNTSLYIEERTRKQSQDLPDRWTNRMDVKVVGSRERGQYDSSKKEIRAGDSQVALHELGHAVEYQIPEVGRLARSFFDRRTEGLQREALYPGVPGRADEVGFPKAFPTSVYAGRSYAGATEMLSMGLQALFFDTHDFWDVDPEYRDFILHLLLEV